MRRVILAKTTVDTTVLGFGCGRLLREGSRRRRGRLLEEAFGAGIRHFDVARSYGLGVAEEDVGRFGRGKRDQLIIVTKFGIDVSSSGRALQRVQRAIRPVLSAFPGIGRVARRRTGVLLSPRRYDPVTAVRSLEESLRALRTDYVDLFLLHEPTIEGVCGEDTVECLERQRELGKIRAYGVAGECAEVTRMERIEPALTQVVQFANDVLTRNIETLQNETPRGMITFSPFSASLDTVVKHVRRDVATRVRWQEEVGLDCSDSNVVADLLLRYCLQANSEGVVLFCTTRPERIRSLAGAAQSATTRAGSLEGFLKMIAIDWPARRVVGG